MGREEVKKVIEMVKEGKISPEEGERLILAIKKVERDKKVKGKYLRILAVKEDKRANLRVPISLINLVLKLVPDEALTIDMDGEKQELPIREIVDELMKEGTELIEVESDDGKYVKIWVE